MATPTVTIMATPTTTPTTTTTTGQLYDPMQFCFFHNAIGHSIEAYRTKFYDECNVEFLQSSH